ncbi:MAG: TOBE-like domain-containing protein, partial [Curvibacter sp.]
RAIVVGPIARLELLPEDETQAAQQAVIEVQIPASQYRELGLTEGELLVVTPRKARVFVEGKPDLVAAA